jgi:hypothetical protein
LVECLTTPLSGTVLSTAAKSNGERRHEFVIDNFIWLFCVKFFVEKSV